MVTFSSFSRDVTGIRCPGLQKSILNREIEAAEVQQMTSTIILAPVISDTYKHQMFGANMRQLSTCYDQTWKLAFFYVLDDLLNLTYGHSVSRPQHNDHNTRS
jgi:hypothetical protein